MPERSMRVVVVGGHPVIIGVVRLACEGQADLEVVGEADAGAAVPQIATIGVADVLVLDLELPDMDGLEVLRRLRKDGWEGAVLVLSDRTDGATVLEAMRNGADGYLTKADGLRRVGSAIRTIASGARVVDPLLEEAALLELGRFARQAREGAEVVGTLTVRERQILGLLSEGLTMQQIGRRLGISPRTVETHVSKLYRKLDVRTRVQAVARAASLGLIEFR
jgi:DNA-binding NarL/FixJ family response regulator